MRAASYHPSAYRAHRSPGSRVASFALSLTLLVAVLLALLWIGAGMRRDRDPGGSLLTFDVADGERAASVVRRRERPVRAERERPRKAPERPATPPTPPPPVTFDSIPGMIVLSREHYAAADVGRMPRTPGGAATGAGEETTSGGATTQGEPGAAPGGETLYPAEWYREPTRAETAPFMPPGLREGWGVIACRTAPRYRVEDCRELGESTGSGLARAARRAAWQFLVRPPLRNGKPMIGVWVRIRFDLRAARP